ncbi:hypothetical protein J1605_014033 [Eschrichtius robustus]|uniref:Carboxylesterase type B domain-containing protein n=1 Tax=Eschrichtius robustus TaxID=9764 RepID=A0AB34GF24_ESCRO|nr:hypothetical protein J1605_014033 [Eschrichtius robustus]
MSLEDMLAILRPYLTIGRKGCLAHQGASSGYQIWDPPRKQIHVGKTPINAFLGVPFYRPPVGACRFTAPEPPEPREGIRDATTYAPVCLQESWGQITSMYFNTHKNYKWLHFSEDCLYLNVCAPVGALGDPLLPAMVWFPGHAFLVGSASTCDGSKLAAREKAVLVLLRHSLGVLGVLP